MSLICKSKSCSLIDFLLVYFKDIFAIMGYILKFKKVRFPFRWCGVTNVTNAKQNEDCKEQLLHNRTDEIQITITPELSSNEHSLEHSSGEEHQLQHSSEHSLEHSINLSIQASETEQSSTILKKSFREYAKTYSEKIKKFAKTENARVVGLYFGSQYISGTTDDNMCFWPGNSEKQLRDIFEHHNIYDYFLVYF